MILSPAPGTVTVDGVVALADRVRAAGGAPAILITLRDINDSLALAVARASVAPLAQELAPDTRVNAVIVMPGSDARDVAAAVGFLSRAGSTTGQCLTVSPRG